MKKAATSVLLLILIAAIVSSCGSGSGNASPSGTANTGGNAGGNASGATVTFYDGDTVLKTVTVEKGATVESYVPDKEGSTFIDWFATPSMNRSFDFSQPINEDIGIYGGFSQFQEDARTWYIVGSGTSQLLMSSNWGQAIDDEHKLTKKADGQNEFTITLDLIEGDEFQFVINGSWHNKRGFGYITDPKLPDGAEAFSSSGGIGDTNSKGSNIKVMTSGNYTITLKTSPADDTYDDKSPTYSEAEKEAYNQGTYDAIDWVRNGDPLVVSEIVEDYYIKGAKITAWEDVYSDVTKFTNDGSGTYVLEVALEEGDEFIFTSTNTIGDAVSAGTTYIRFNNLDDASQALFDKTGSNNIIIKTAGTYTFTYKADTEVLTATVA
ncbi:MAG: SusF/SusE family outer membrane protein [Clostridiales bacterium]|jgi:hypothetical protein|nr:SusF/SusE family outer membrane protein [Clostridiales bacterium]